MEILVMTIILKKNYRKHTAAPKGGAQWLKKHYTKNKHKAKKYIVKAT